MPVTKEIAALLGLLISFTPVLPVMTARGQPVKTKSFTEWCQNKMSVLVETRKTIDLLLKEAGTNNCKTANSKLRKLTSLDIRDNQISDMKPLASLTNLTSLDLSDNHISDIKPLAALTNLISLSLNGNHISDIKPLAALTNLTDLSLIANEIIDIKPLASLTNLTEIYLGGNKIIDIKPLASLINLRHLNLSSNKITKKICPVKPELICYFERQNSP
jgi:internalin A